MRIGTLTSSLAIGMAVLTIALLLTGYTQLLAVLVVGSLLYAIYTSRQFAAQTREMAEYRRLLAADAKCLFWAARVQGREGWRKPAAAVPYGPFDWHLWPLDQAAAELVVGPGFAPAEYGHLWSAAMYPEDRAESNRRFHQAILDGAPHLTQAFRVRDYTGRTRWYLENVRIIPTADSQWNCTGVCIDITDRKDAEEAVRQSEQSLRQLMLEGKSLLFEIEAQAPPEYDRLPEPHLLQWKHQPVDPEILQNLLPLEPSASGQYYFNDFTRQRHPEDSKRIDRTFAEAVAKHAPGYAQEYRCRNRFGSYQWFSETVHLTYLPDRRWRLTGVVQDITARKRVEESIQDVMRQADCVVFYGTVSTAEDPTDETQYHWEMRVADLDAAQRVLPLQLAPGQTYVSAWVKARDTEDMRAGTEHHVRAFRDKLAHFSHAFRARDRHGEWHWISEDVRLEQIAPRTYNVVTVCVDITAQKRVQETLERARIAAEEASNAKTAFLANMSHEIRTPMTAVVGYADLLTESVSAAERESYAKTIQRNCEHLMTVLDDILDLSRIESGKMAIQNVPCSPVQVAEEVADMLRPKALEKGLELSVEVKTDVPRQILSDPVRLRQILVNLAGNAVKFTDQGTVVIRIDAQSADGEPQLVVSVEDTGIGIPAEQIPQLFRPFQQGDLSNRRRFGGTGLGLAISRRLAQLLGGDVSVTSKPGHGSCFTLRILGKQVEQVAPRQASPARGPSRLDGIRVLLAEDGADTRRLVCIHLRRLGCECISVENGQEATDRVLESEATSSPFDVILMDMQMPVLDGYSACKVLRDKGYTRAIIALTAHAMEGDRERCINSGCDDYVVKPIDIVQLSSAIAKHAHKQPKLASA